MELTMLAYSLVLAWVMFMAGSMLRINMLTPKGLMLAMHNRADLPEASAMSGRADRAARNMLDNLVLFAALVLMAKVSDVSNANTVLGAQIFFWARLVYFPIYVFGIPVVRTIVWAVSTVGMAMILLELL